MPRGRFNNAKPQSGLPGLIWRQRGKQGDGGTWVVSLAVPKALQSRVVNRAGKPLTRLERTTGTDSLKRAKELYPAVMSQLRQELANRAGATLMESKQDASLRVVGDLYRRLAAPEASPQHNAALAQAQAYLGSAANLPLDQLEVMLGEVKLMLDAGAIWLCQEWLTAG